MFNKSPLPRRVWMRTAVVALTLTTLLTGGFSSLPIGNTRVSAALPLVAPANDKFADAQPILGVSGVVFGNTVGATKEPLEQNIEGIAGTGSVWYKWQAPFSGRFVFTTSGSDFNTLLGVYSGANLPGIQVSANDDDDLLCPIPGSFSQTLSRVSFDAVGGLTYHIAVDTKSGSAGNIYKLRWGRSATINVRPTTVSKTPPSGSLGSKLEGDICVGGPFFIFTFNNVPTGGNYTVSVLGDIGYSYRPDSANESISPLAGDVTLVYYLQTPAYTISGVVMGLPSNNMTGVTVKCVSKNGGIISQPANIAIGVTLVTFECRGLPANAEYLVTPSKLGFSFAPADKSVQLFGDTGLAAFVATAAPSQTISGRVTLIDSPTGVSGVAVGLSGSETASTMTDATGNYSFTVLHGGNYSLTPSHPNFMIAPASLSFTNVTAAQTGNFEANFLLQLILDDAGQAAALDSVLHTRDPFPVIDTANVLNQGVDRNTRVAIFVSNFQLGSGELPSSVVINLVDSSSQSFDIPAEDVRSTSNPAFTQVIFRLPDTLSPGICTLFVKAHGLTSNIGAIKIRV